MPFEKPADHLSEDEVDLLSYALAGNRSTLLPCMCVYRETPAKSYVLALPSCPTHGPQSTGWRRAHGNTLKRKQGSVQ